MASGVDRLPRLGLLALLMAYYISHMAFDIFIAHISQLRHPSRRGCTFFKPVYFFPQGTRKVLL